MATPMYKADGSKATAPTTLDTSVFGVVPENHDLLKQVYTAYLSNGRTRNAVTLKRGEVSGGGKKPWKQKGTGRARFGSSRNPIWRGGGIAFGPTGNENYSKHVTTKAKRLAVRQALSLAAAENKLVIIENFAAQEAKTASVVSLLQAVGAQRRTLIVVDTLSDDIVRATNNLSNVKLIQATYLNAYDVLNADTIVIAQPALETISVWLAVEAKTTESQKVEA